MTALACLVSNTTSPAEGTANPVPV